jgi:AcrR family transcriptional regulator
MGKKATGQTAQEILEVALALCNRLGCSQVSTTRIAAEMGISPGNLYYHYSSKAALINCLVERHHSALSDRLRRSDLVRDLPQAAAFFQALLELSWHYRFLCRDLNQLLSDHLCEENQVQKLRSLQQAALLEVLQGLVRGQVVMMLPREYGSLITSWMLVLMYWLSWESVRDPSLAGKAESAGLLVAHGVEQMLQMLAPYLQQRGQRELQALLAAGDGLPAGLTGLDGGRDPARLASAA